MPDWFSLDWTLTIIGLVMCGAAYWFSSYRAGLPRDDMKPKRLPWHLFMVLSAFAGAMVFVHVINLVGVETGPENSLLGRMR